MREEDFDRAERKATLENDLKVLRQQQGSTYFSHTHDDVGGRFRTSEAPPRVIGATPTPAAQYPAASAAHQTQLPNEEPLGYRIDAMPGDELSTVLPAVEATDDPAAAPSGPAFPTPLSELGVERAGSPFLQTDKRSRRMRGTNE